MVEVIAQSLLLEKGKAAHDWCTRSEGCQEFWTGSGDWKGLLDSAHRKPNLERRSAVSKVIVEQYEAASLKPPTAGLQAFEEGAAVVTVGHQLQAGGGPAYFHYKILSALRWSRQLREAGIESVAVFWMASEDHDFEEVSRTVGAQSDAFVWSPETIAGSAPVGRIVWDANAERDWLAFCERQGLVSERSSSQVPGQTESLAHRLRQWIQGWFPEDDLLVIDGDHLQLKTIAQPLWDAEWEGSGIQASLEAQAQQYEQRWGATPLQPRANNLFVIDTDSQRIRADRWNGDPATLSSNQNSPNAALRPLYQEYLLESAGFVGGPSEVAYWLMLGSAFQRHGIAHPTLLLRDGAFVFDAVASDAAKQLGWLPGASPMTGDAAVSALAECALNALGQPEMEFKAWSEALVAYAEGIPGDAVPTTRAALARMEKELAQVRKKWRKVWKQAHVAECERVASAFDEWICPKGQPQERVISALVLAQAAGGWDHFKALWFKSLLTADESAFLVYQSEG